MAIWVISLRNAGSRQLIKIADFEGKRHLVFLAFPGKKY